MYSTCMLYLNKTFTLLLQTDAVGSSAHCHTGHKYSFKKDHRVRGPGVGS